MIVLGKYFPVYRFDIAEYIINPFIGIRWQIHGIMAFISRPGFADLSADNWCKNVGAESVEVEAIVNICRGVVIEDKPAECIVFFGLRGTRR